jgi:hypothetical protein
VKIFVPQNGRPGGTHAGTRGLDAVQKKREISFARDARIRDWSRCSPPEDAPLVEFPGDDHGFVPIPVKRHLVSDRKLPADVPEHADLRSVARERTGRERAVALVFITQERGLPIRNFRNVPRSKEQEWKSAGVNNPAAVARETQEGFAIARFGKALSGCTPKIGLARDDQNGSFGIPRQFRRRLFPSLGLIAELTKQQIRGLRTVRRRRIRGGNARALLFVGRRRQKHCGRNQRQQDRARDEQDFAVTPV